MQLKRIFLRPRLLVGIFGAMGFASAGVVASPNPPAGAVFSKPVAINGVVFEAWVSKRTVTVTKYITD